MTTTKDSAATLTDETLDLLYEHSRGQTTGQIEWSDQLDSKGAQLFAAGSVVVGLAGLGMTGDARMTTIVLFIAVVCYVGLAIAAFFLLRVREWFVSGHADILWREHWADSPRDIKHAIVEDAAQAVAHNRALLLEKSRWLLAVQVLLTVEVISVGMAVVTARLA